MIVSVVAHPRASRARLAWDGGVLHVWVAAAAVEGRANEAVLDLVAGALGVARSQVHLVRGARGRSKLVRVDGADPASLDGLRAPDAR